MREFEALPKRQLVTAFININSLAGTAHWSTIKILPATYPNSVPWTVGHGPGLLEPLLIQIWMSVGGGGDVGCRCGGHELLLDVETNTKFKNIFLTRYSLHLSSYFWQSRSLCRLYQLLYRNHHILIASIQLIK